MAYARAWTACHKAPGQQSPPRLAGRPAGVLWGFHDTHTGRCFPSYERIAEKAEFSRTTVYQALKVLEWAGVLTWQHRLRIRERCTDLFGRGDAWRWRVIRTSNAYAFQDPMPWRAARCGRPQVVRPRPDPPLRQADINPADFLPTA